MSKHFVNSVLGVATTGAAGMAMALLLWRNCYQHSDMAKASGTIMMVALGLFALVPAAALAYRLPSWILVGLLVPSALVAACVYWWLVNSTGANRCASYREPRPPSITDNTSGGPPPSISGPTTGPPPTTP